MPLPKICSRVFAARRWTALSAVQSNRREFLFHGSTLVSFPGVDTGKATRCSRTVTTMASDKLLDAVKQVVPPLAKEKLKGQAGKIATIGGSREYTGAPYFSSISCLKVGADLSHVFCTEGAATVIKSYSPELIVHPYLPVEGDAADSGKGHEETVAKAVEGIQHWLPRFDVVTIGPGLGRDAATGDTVIEVMRRCRAAGQYMVIDADGLYHVTKNHALVSGYSRVVLTPNHNELGRLAASLDLDPEQERATLAKEIAKRLAEGGAGPTLVSKGPADVITDSHNTVQCKAKGSLRRAGGQGDVTSGSIATMLAWATTYGSAKKLQSNEEYPGGVGPTILAAYGGCFLVRKASEVTFKAKRRAMVAGDIIEHLGPAFAELYDTD